MVVNIRFVIFFAVFLPLQRKLAAKLMIFIERVSFFFVNFAPMNVKQPDMNHHPLDLFRFCPVCGSSLFVVNNVKSKHCRQCGFTYYANPSSATAAFIIDSQNRLLVARRGKDPARGTLDLVGGFADMYETVEQAMLREIEEEAGLHLDQPRYLFSIPNRYLYSGMTIHTLDMFFRFDVPAGIAVSAADDAAELMWIPLPDVRPELFGLDSIRQAVARFLSEHVDS